MEADKASCAKTKWMMHNDNSGIFTRIGCFKGTFSLKIKDDAKVYQKPPKHVAYSLQKLIRKELEMLQEQEILAQLGMDETVECPAALSKWLSQMTQYTFA